MEESVDITRQLEAHVDGDSGALGRLFPVVYEHLKHLAGHRLRQERPDHTLNATGLVHEAFLKFRDLREVRYENRAHFYAMMSRTMRRILIDYAKRRRAQKNRGAAPHLPLDEECLIPDACAETLLELNDLLQRFEALYPRPAQVIAHRYFSGLTNEEIAVAMEVSLSTVERDLRFARAWLSRAWKA